jgi:hypothetical protein
MRVEIVDEPEGKTTAFPPEDNYLDLRANPQAVGKIAGARRHLPLWNFLTAVNGEGSIFATANATTRTDLPTTVSADKAYEFASQVELVFAEPSLNFERKRYLDLGSGLQELLDRDTPDTVRVVLRISSRDFTAENRLGFCLGIRMVAEGDSAQQAELRWGLGLARVQQALLFRSRAQKQQISE